MKLIYLHSGKFPSNTPSMSFVVFNALGLANHFDKVFLIMKNNSKLDTEIILKNEYDVFKPNNLIIKRLRINPFIRSSFMFNLLSYLHIKAIIKEEKADVVITRYIKFLPWLCELKNKFKIKVFFESHDLYSKHLLMKDGIEKNISLAKIEEKYIPKLDGVFCLQQTQIDLYKKLISGYNNFYLARTGINQVNEVEFSNRKYISYIGSFDKHKGLYTLLRVYSKIETKYKLVLIGGKSINEIETLQKEIHKLKISDRVIITGWIRKAEVNHYLAQTILGVVPLESTFFNQYLTSPLKIFDYISFGCPMLASDLPTLRELIIEEEMGLFYNPSDENDMLIKMKKLIDDVQLLKNMSQKVYNTAQKFLWTNRAYEIKKIIMGNLNE